MSDSPASDVRTFVWDAKYRLRGPSGGENDLDQTWARVARAVAAAERPDARARWTSRFHALLASGAFFPGGRIIAGAGAGNEVTLFNCFVMGPIHDSVAGILRALRESAVTMQHGGGVGIDFSTLRPRGSPAHSTGGVASGPVSFMDIWDSTCETLLSTSRRRGAMMAALRCDHPDIELFIDAKRKPGVLRNFNLSVLVSERFMEAVDGNLEWRLVFPSPDAGRGAHRRGRTVRSVRARELWQRLLHAAYDSAEPGVLFIDRINASNNLRWRERIQTTNPCGEVPLPAYGACNLGSLNLPHFIRDPFDARSRLDHAALAEASRIATRLLDNVIDVSRFPLLRQRKQAHQARRIGLGVTGLADALLMLGLRYGSDASCTAASQAMATVCHAAYDASVDLALERGPFPVFEVQPYLDAPFVQTLPGQIRERIAAHGIRNSHLTAIAPAGTISLLAGGVSSGAEPIFSARFRRRMRDGNGAIRELEVEDPALRAWRQRGGEGMPPGYVDVSEVTPTQQLLMQRALQRHVDNAVSKTVTVPAGLGFEDFADLYARAHALGLKGCTAYRPTPLRGAVLEPVQPQVMRAHCHGLDREPC